MSRRGTVICVLWLAGCGASAAGGGGTGGTSTTGTGGMLGGGSGGAPSSTGSGGSAGGGSGGTATGGGSGGGSDGAAIDAPVIQPADAGQPPTDAAQGACIGAALKPGTSTQMLSFGGGMRSYIIHVPPKYDGKTRMPLLLDMHGQGQTAQGQMGTSGWLAKADAAGIVMIYPQGLYNSWNGGPPGCPILMCCCDPAQTNKVDDVGFIRAVVAKTMQDGCIDLKRIYATGLSNGGCMSQWLGCDAADLFAAVAPVSCANMIDCKPTRPITIVEYRGKQDNIVPYNGGMIAVGKHNWPSAMADFQKWSDLDKCTDTAMPLPMRAICQVHNQCAGGAEVILCSPNTGHVLYGGAAQQMAPVTDLAWEVFQRHPLP